MRCKKCGFKNDDVRFCTNCGEPLFIKCFKCGFVNKPDSKFCGNCGANLLFIKDESKQLLSSIQNKLLNKINITNQKFKGSRRNVAIIFADISGFTMLSENLDPEEVTEIMNKIFQKLSDIIYNYEGYIDKFIGDCVMALFGAPITHENDSLRAVFCSIEMLGAMREFKDLELSIGINYGRVVAGEVGSDKKVEFTVMGDAVNLAERIQSAAIHSQILVSENIRKLTKNEVKYKILKPIKVKGKSELVQIYQPIKIISKYSIREFKEQKLIGRREELDKLYSLYKKVELGKKQIVAIIGEAGIGKSKLIMEFQKILNNKALIFEGKGVEYKKGSTYNILKKILNDLFNIKDDDSKNKMSLKIKNYITKLENKMLLGIIPFLKYFFSLKLDNKQQKRFQSMRPADRIRMLEESIIYLLRIISENKPLIIILDDSHWIDKETLTFMLKFIRLIKEESIMFIFIYRPEFEIVEITKLSNYHQINLKKFTAKEVIKFIKNISNFNNISKALITFLISESGSNPFYLQELITTLLERNLTKIEKDTITILPIKEKLIPDTLNDLIMSKIDHFDEESKYLLKIASTIGIEFSIKMLKTLVDVDQGIVINLEKIEKKGIIYRIASDIDSILTGDETYIFRHIITRDVIYESILKNNRIMYHNKIGDLIENMYSEKIEDYYDQLAYHYNLGDNRKKALIYIKKSAEKKKALYINNDAIIRYQEYISYLDKKKDALTIAKIYEDIGDIYILIGESDKALNSYKKMVNFGKNDIIFIVRSKISIAQIFRGRSGYDKAFEYLNSAQEILKSLENNDETLLESARIYTEKCWIYRIKGELKKSKTSIKKSLKILSDISKNKILGKKLNRAKGKAFESIATLFFMQGKYKRAFQNWNNSLNLYKRSNNKIGIAGIYDNLCVVYYAQCKYEKAKKMCNKALKINKDIGNKHGLSICYGNLGNVLLDYSEYSKAKTAYKKYLKISKEIGSKQGIAGALWGLGTVYLIYNQYQDSEKSLNKCLNESNKMNYPQGKAVASNTLGSLYIKLGKFKLAKKHLEQAESIAKKINDIYTLTETYLRFSMLSLKEVQKTGIRKNAKGIQKSENYVKIAINNARKLGVKILIAQSLFQLSQISLLKNDFEKAENYIKQSLKIYKALNLRKKIADSYIELSRLYYKIGNIKLYKMYNSKAKAIYTKLKLKFYTDLQ